MTSTASTIAIAAARRAVQEGKLDAARRMAADILAAELSNLDALEIKALVDAQGRNPAAAEPTLRAAIAIAPHRRWPYADLTRLLLKLDRPADAEAVARAALKVDPANPDGHAMLGSILAGRQQWFDAAGHFEQAIALAGRHPQLLTGLGHALLRSGKLQEARPLLQSAIGADPNALEPRVYLAELEERAGRFDEAGTQLDRAEPIARAAGTDIDLQRSVLLARIGRDHEALALLEDRQGLAGAALLQRGRLLERMGRYTEAWNDWTSAKAELAAKRHHAYDAVGVEAEANALSSFFNAERNARLLEARPPSDVTVVQPIFIIGFPRSGTTLVEQILASHSAIRAGGELPFGSELRELAASLAGGEAAFPEGLREIADWPAILRARYLERAAEFGLLAHGAAYFTDKMPTNDMWLPLLRLAFPQSPVIVVRRNPLDVLTSVMSHDMTHGFHCAYRLEDAAQHLALVDRLLGQFSAAGVGPTHELRYESLVADQVGETERLMTAIGLGMEPAQLSFEERGAVSPTPSYAQVAQPLNNRSIARWRHYAAQLETARSIVSVAMRRGNYAG